MKYLKAIHLSDLHLDPDHAHDQQYVLDALFKDIKKIAAEEQKIDFIFFTGDLVAKGKYSDTTTSYVKKIFIDPLLAASGVPPELLFITPGNHDVNQKKADKFLEPIYDSYTKHDEVNALLADIDSRPLFWNQLRDFNESLSEYGQAIPVLKNDLYRAYSINVRDIKVGIACINSAWRSSGKPGNHDYGNLLVGERQAEDLYKSILDAEIKIGLIHHPLEWLTPFDRPPVQRALYRNLNALLHGHNHTSDAISVATSAGQVFISNAGCLYQSRSYFNGYSVLNLEIDNAQYKWTVSVREYFEERQEFDISSRFAKDGQQIISIPKSASSNFLLPTTAYIEIVNEKLNSKLLSYAASDVAPKNLHGIFVEPPLSHLSEQQFRSGKTGGSAHFLNLRELAFNDRAIFFLGRKELGKTTILNFLCSKANDPSYLAYATHAVYIDLSSITKKTRATLLEAAVNFSGGEYKRADITQLLSDGRIIVCFDNFPLRQTDTLKLIVEFVKEFQKCKYCFAADEGIEESLTDEFIPTIALDSQIVFIHTFNRKQTRDLVARWMPESAEVVQEKLNSILSSIRALGIPQTPFLISMLLWIKEKNINFTPVNRSAIIDTFIDGLLEKFTETKDRSNTDSKIKRHFLTDLAYGVHLSKKIRWTQNELEAFTVDYFKKKALSSSTIPFLEELFSKGILLEN